MAQQQIITCGPFAFMWLMFCSYVYYAYLNMCFNFQGVSFYLETKSPGLLLRHPECTIQ